MTGETMYAPTVKEVESSDQYGRFTIEPLEPGFGTTLGNSLRRVLLSSLPGAAVTAVSIDGVAHEFSAVPYVKEDVTEILLNVKGLHVISHSDDPVRLSLEVKGERVVTAGDIEANSLVEICNPEMYICALSGKDATLRMELVVERGKGYLAADKNKKEGQPIGVIPVDATFTPVEKANFVIEKTRVGQDTNWDRLVMEVWTNKTLNPVDAISEAAAIFTSHLDLFVHFRTSIETPPVTATSGGNDLQTRLANVPVEELDLSVRALNCLKANDVTTVGQLVAMREEELLTLRNFGKKSFDEVKQKLIEKQLVSEEELVTLFASSLEEQE